MNHFNVMNDLKKKRSLSSFNSRREKGWDDRFIYNKIPDYCAFKDHNFISNKLYLENVRRNNEFCSTTKTKFFRRPLDKSNISYNTYKEISKEMDPNEKLHFLWNQLGVTDGYKELYFVVANQLDDNGKKNFLYHEMNSLSALCEDLNTFMIYINSKDIAINNLKKLNDKLSKSLKNSHQKSNEMYFKQISQEIQNLRLCTISIVRQMNKIRSSMNYNISGGKFNVDIIERNFCFDKNYLIKMKEELMFLKYGYIKYFFNINDNIDPFLISTSDETLDPLQQRINITEELSEEIKNCEFLILQDLIFYQLSNFKSHKVRTISPIRKKYCSLSSLNNSNCSYRTISGTSRGFQSKKKDDNPILFLLKNKEKKTSSKMSPRAIENDEDTFKNRESVSYKREEIMGKDKTQKAEPEKKIEIEREKINVRLSEDYQTIAKDGSQDLKSLKKDDDDFFDKKNKDIVSPQKSPSIKKEDFENYSSKEKKLKDDNKKEVSHSDNQEIKGENMNVEDHLKPKNPIITEKKEIEDHQILNYVEDKISDQEITEDIDVNKK